MNHAMAMAKEVFCIRGMESGLVVKRDLIS